MGDVFVEQLIKQQPSVKTLLVKAIAIMVGVSVCGLAAFMLLFTGVSSYGPIVLLVAVGAIYLAIKFVTGLDYEFEYIYTNGEIDVDRIAGKRKRKRITTVKISAFDVFEKYDHQKYAKEKFDARIMAQKSIDDEETYCATYIGKEGKRCLLVFTPNEKMLASINSVSRRRRV